MNDRQNDKRAAAGAATNAYDSALRLLAVIDRHIRAKSAPILGKKPQRAATWSDAANGERIMSDLWELASRFYLDSTDGSEADARAMAMQAAFAEIVGGAAVTMPEAWVAVDTDQALAYGTFPSADIGQDWCEAQGERADEYFVTRLLCAGTTAPNRV